MKTPLWLALVLFFALLLPVSAADVFINDLSYGLQNNADVLKLQEFLTVEGLYSGPMTGNFYSLTLQGVKKFQSRENISPISGYFGPLSRGKANGLIGANAVSEVDVSPTSTKKNATETQIDALLQQIQILQAQLQAIQNVQTTLNQQNTTLQQIQTNTTPPPPPPPLEPTPLQEPPPVGTPPPPQIIQSLKSPQEVAPTVSFSYLGPILNKEGSSVVKVEISNILEALKFSVIYGGISQTGETASLMVKGGNHPSPIHAEGPVVPDNDFSSFTFQLRSPLQTPSPIKVKINRLEFRNSDGDSLFVNVPIESGWIEVQ